MTDAIAVECAATLAFAESATNLIAAALASTVAALVVNLATLALAESATSLIAAALVVSIATLALAELATSTLELIADVDAAPEFAADMDAEQVTERATLGNVP
jgi:hypothetical protein